MNNFAVKISNVSKKYLLRSDLGPYHSQSHKAKSNKFFSAIKRIDLNIKKGSKVGLIGPNGSGKTTLLKIISGITTPTSGTVETNGKVAALINLEAGFYSELSGEENILLNGLLMGLTKNEVKADKAKIIKFADIGKFIKAPFYTYSSGMKFRLAFAIALSSRSDILVLDEIFVAGDIEFQEKAITTIKAIQKEKKVTTIVCSHTPMYILEFSDTFYQINQGKLTSISKRTIISNLKKENQRWKKTFSVLRTLY